MKRKLELCIVIMGTLGILFTLIFHVLDNPTTPIVSGLEIFKYFTILSNLIVVIYFWLMFSLKLDKSDNFNKLLGGVTVYITVTGIIFTLILQKDFNQVGFDKVGSIICHYIMPVLTIGFLVIYRKDYNFSFKDILKWMIFPVLYLILVLIRGAITSDYIYPFLELDTLGLGRFILTILSLLVFFVLLSSIYVLITKEKKRV